MQGCCMSTYKVFGISNMDENHSISSSIGTAS
jgi:hypothetical protein